MSNELSNETKEFFSRIITSIKTTGKFDTSNLTDEENIKEMNKRIGKKITEAEQQISKGRDIIKKGNWVIQDGEER